jgi:hypothetical protein
MPRRDGTIELRQKGRIISPHSRIARNRWRSGRHRNHRVIPRGAKPQFSVSTTTSTIRWWTHSRSEHDPSAICRRFASDCRDDRQFAANAAAHPQTQPRPQMSREHPNDRAVAAPHSQTLAISESKQFPMSKQINLVINSQGESERADCRAASADLFIDFFDEIRKLDRTVLAQILVHSPD